VQTVMKELAVLYGFDPEKAELCGLLHDAAKDLPQTEIDALLDALLNEGKFKITCEAERDFVHYLHAPLGEIYVRQKFSIKDEAVLGAIGTHAFMKIHPAFHSPMSWCLRFADLIEPTRNWSAHPLMDNGAAVVRELVYSGKFWQAAYHQTDTLIKWFTERGVTVHPDMFEVRDEVREKCA